MNFISSILSNSLGKTVSVIGDTVKKFVTTDKDRMGLQLELEDLLQKRDSEIEQTIRRELEAKEKILVAELTQGNNFVKMARPSVVYFGLFVIFINYCLVPVIQMLSKVPVQTINLPVEFWAGWSGIVATWCIGRSAEKRGSRSKVVSLITGSKID